MKLAEPIAILDTFTSGLGRVEIMKGGCARFILYAEMTLESGEVENVVVAKIVMPIDAVPEAIGMASAATASTLVGSIKKLMPRFH